MTAELNAGLVHTPAPGYFWPAPVPATVTITAGLTFSPPPCGQCPETATCCYDYGNGSQYACKDHDPTRQPGWVTMATPPSFAYRSLGFGPIVTGSTGHLGMALPA